MNEDGHRLLADEYVGRILTATYRKPMSIQQISRACDIPIAVAYRRVGRMESLGLLRVVSEGEAYPGKKVKFYSCAVRSFAIRFREGQLTADLDLLPNVEDIVAGVRG
ncbi:MAG TPA: helix-turn-helix domain-containing protein [Methanomassiliicoccales archaeon]|nr:helix-turn-helix domain-containing protein [Methanomassiliicoccales archaeon]